MGHLFETCEILIGKVIDSLRDGELGFSILFFSLLVLIYAPGKTIAAYGIIIDMPGATLSQIGKTSKLLILLVVDPIK